MVILTTSFMDGPKKECQTTHHPECKKIPHTVYVEKCDVNTEQKCETVYESVQVNLCPKLFFFQNMVRTCCALNVKNNFCTQHVLPMS